MKSIVKTLIITAVLMTAPAHAVVGRLQTTFANIHNARKPLTALGALIGIGSTGYLVKQAMPKKNFDCNRHIAEITRATLQWRGDNTQYNLWMKEQNKAFRYCRWTMPGTTRKELYETNIAYAQKRAKQYRAEARWYSGHLDFIDRMFGQEDMRSNITNGYAHLYEQTTKQLQYDLKKEQEAQRKQAQRIRELEQLTWLHFA